MRGHSHVTPRVPQHPTKLLCAQPTRPLITCLQVRAASNCCRHSRRLLLTPVLALLQTEQAIQSQSEGHICSSLDLKLLEFFL